MTFRIFNFVLLGLTAAVGSLARADDIVPKAPVASTYARMASHSPFAPPTAPVAAPAAPTPPPVPGWADNLTATMIMRDGNKYMVTVVDSQNPQQHLYLTSDPDKATQMAVASVKWGANRDEPPTVTLSKGKEFAQIKYESGASSPGGNNSPGGAPPIPGGVRGPLPGGASMAGAQPFRPPPAIPGQNGNPTPSSAGFRRPLIRAPSVAAPQGPARPALNQANPVTRRNPAVQQDDDDDD